MCGITESTKVPLTLYFFFFAQQSEAHFYAVFACSGTNSSKQKASLLLRAQTFETPAKLHNYLFHLKSG